MGTSRPSAPTPPAASSTCTTSGGSRSAPKRSTTGHSSLAKRLPDWRTQVLGDLRRRGLHRDRVLAVAHQLLDRGYFRAGGEEYAQENGSFGLATLRREHVRVRNASVEFDYPAKSGVRRTIELEDPLVVRAVRSSMHAQTRLPRLLVFRSEEGDWLGVARRRRERTLPRHRRRRARPRASAPSRQ